MTSCECGSDRTSEYQFATFNCTITQDYHGVTAHREGEVELSEDGVGTGVVFELGLFVLLGSVVGIVESQRDSFYYRGDFVPVGDGIDRD